jgi:hypothetical protein
MSCPVALLAVSTPITVPRLVSNHRLTMMAPRTTPTLPLPRPTSNPQVRSNCHGLVIKHDRPAARPMSPSAATSVRRRPKRSMNAAAKGPIKPYKTILTPIAAEMVAGDQPNSRSSGTMNIVGAERTPAATIIKMNAIAAATYA